MRELKGAVKSAGIIKEGEKKMIDEFRIHRDIISIFTINKLKSQYIKTESLRAQLVGADGERLAKSGLRVACQIGENYFPIKYIDAVLQVAEAMHEDVIFVHYSGTPKSEFIYLQVPIAIIGVGGMEILIPAVKNKGSWGGGCIVQMIVMENREN